MKKTIRHPTFVAIEVCKENLPTLAFYLENFSDSCFIGNLPGDNMVEICLRKVGENGTHPGPHGWALRRQPQIAGPRDATVSLEIFREMQGL